VTISELGSLGEFISSIAVLTTLIYLSIQVRQARAESTASSIKDRGSAMRDTMLTGLTDDVLSQAMVKASTVFRSHSFEPPLPVLLEAGLSEIEAHKIQQWYTLIMHVYMTQHEVMDPGHRQIQDGGIRLNFTEGIGRTLWDAYLKTIFREMSPGFVDHVAGVIAEHDAENAGL
jgi:hypothetical protein